MSRSTDSAMLETRLELNQRLSDFDLNQWIFGHFPFESGQKWLDLGCGTGKQSIPLSRGGCEVVAVDASEESLAALKAAAPDVRTILSDMDQFGASSAERFDRGVASYSLYYAKDHVRLFENLARLTDAFFFCGPAHANNIELRRLVADLGGKPVGPTFASSFMEETGPQLAREHFAQVDIFTFENEVVFPSADELYSYWSSHGSFDPSLDQRFREDAEKLPMPFVNVKRGIGVAARR